MSNNILEVLSDALTELATELDLHYQVSDAPKLAPTLETMQRAVSALEDAGWRVPDACVHVLNRYSRKAH